MKRHKEKVALKAAIREQVENLRALGLTVVTVSSKSKIIIKSCWNYISTRKAGVTFSQKIDAKKSIMGKTKEKKNHSKANFTISSQKCEEASMCRVHFLVLLQNVEEGGNGNIIFRRVCCSIKYKLPPLIFHWKITARLQRKHL